ncbi:putative nucleic acid-binding protein [Medicago truncatula]|uniref:Putative nucleic acid-binding protein n=1 Tax=Medicago truncatula TaxID=3880 RepID=A0A396HVE2_MEDTR|nr:putative nucleic acid-binding protein [Medicago truncatula]
MAVNLTQGAIITMCFTSEVWEPVLQVFDMKLVQSQQNNTTEPYRLVLSDGLYYQQGMLVVQKNHLVHSGRLQKGSIVKLSHFYCDDVLNNKLSML